jgi:hypothetical protein
VDAIAGDPIELTAFSRRGCDDGGARLGQSKDHRASNASPASGDDRDLPV